MTLRYLYLKKAILSVRLYPPKRRCHRFWINSKMSSIIFNCTPRAKDNAHHSQYRKLTTQYEGIDPGRGKRKRKAIAEKLRKILEKFEAKADQIYALYDVVE